MSYNQSKEECLAAFREQRWAEMAREEVGLAARIEEEERLEQQRAEEARRAEEVRKAEEARWAKEAKQHEEKKKAAEEEKAAASHKRTMSDNAEAGPSQKRPKVVCM
ncbi:hypothetical protein AX17_007284, partial [Amanita inopinata Kibby_2008]